jgi:tRNA nucleotidyltransferase (CCA-adding enzyme)
VGGAVRDRLLKIPSVDIDIVAEGDPAALAGLTAKQYRAKIKHYPRFGTFVLDLPGGGHIDFATARKETYPRPGALPKVKPSKIKDDLKRRDFTINAVALALSGRKPALIDLYGGLKDLKEKKLRVLHADSFKDDPTRMLRLARFASRGFGVEKKTFAFLKKHRRYISTVTPERITEELLGILKERKPSLAVALLKKWGILKRILPQAEEADLNSLDMIPSVQGRLAALFSKLDDKNLKGTMNRLKLTRKLKSGILKLRAEQRPAPRFSGRDLITLGYSPGPAFKKMLVFANNTRFRDRREAVAALFDKFPRKR